jgi:hypothetical protein
MSLWGGTTKQPPRQCITRQEIAAALLLTSLTSMGLAMTKKA